MTQLDEPLRVCAIAPSGSRVELVSYFGVAGEVTSYNGRLTAREDTVFQAAWRLACKARWQEARDKLSAAGWRLVEVL